MCEDTAVKVCDEDTAVKMCDVVRDEMEKVREVVRGKVGDAC